jgi:FkbM family methyltransferase
MPQDNRLCRIWKETLNNKRLSALKSIKRRQLLGSATVNAFGRMFPADDPSHSVTQFIRGLMSPEAACLSVGEFHFPLPGDRSEELIFAPALQDFYAQYAMDLDIGSDYALYDLLLEGPGEYHAVMIHPGDVVIDAGANIGDFSLLAAKKVEGGGLVFAFEPVADVYNRYLLQTLELNPSLADRIAPIPAGLLEADGMVTFYTNPDFMDEASVIQNHRTIGTEPQAQVYALDSFVAENKLERVDFIKADIEGAERYMLQGATETLARYAPKLSIANYHLPDDPVVLENLILDANPQYKIIQKWKKLFAYVPGQ